MRLLPTKSFKKKDTIKNNKEIKNVIYSGQKIKSHHIDIFYLYGKKERMAVLLNRKIKKAHERNKIKRIVREVYRNENLREKKEILIKIKSNIINQTYKEIKEELTALFCRID